MSATPQFVGGTRATTEDSKEKIVRVYVWQMPVRIAHWLIVLSIAVLSVTGYYLYDPFIISRGNRAFMLGRILFIHLVAGFVFIAAFLTRMYGLFSGNKWARWQQFLPVGGRQWHDFVKQLKYYLFLDRQPAFRVGHNPLAGATYSVIFILMLIESLTGLALLNHIAGNKVLGFFVDWVPALVSIHYVREIHFLIMFAFGAFLIHHVYSAVLIGIEERSGLVGGMFSGYKFFAESRVIEDAQHDMGTGGQAGYSKNRKIR
jgi:Ni/Fe-hydrogenase 1 B-type cytochrome subunit